MAKVVRNSKFRHVYGQSAKKQDCYDNIRITKSSWDSTFCCVNPKFIAIITEAAGGGAFLVLPVEKVGRVDRDIPLVVGHKAAVLDIAWCPHNDNLIASASEDCTIKVWEIPNAGLSKNLTDCVADLVAHQRRVGVISWHPSAHLILLSAGADFKVFVWNVATAEILAEINAHADVIYSANWNYNGSRIVTTCKDKNIRLFDARTGALIKEGKGHQAVKPMRAIFMKDGRIFTTGFSRTGERQYALWDQVRINRHQASLCLVSKEAVLFPKGKARLFTVDYRRVGQQQWCVVSVLRRGHEHDLFVWQRRLGHSLFRIYGRSALHTLFEHVFVERPAAWHGHDDQTGSQRFAMRNFKVSGRQIVF
jgi:coronin-1B/1C/6